MSLKDEMQEIVLKRQQDISEQTPEIIDEAIAKIRKIQQEGNKIKDHEERLYYYAKWLSKHIEYDIKGVGEFYSHKEDEKFDYASTFNVSRLFIERKGACQQFAIALAMLCYDDPYIECYQTIIKRKSKSDGKEYKHSATYVRVPGKEGIVDPVNFKSRKFLCSREEYIKRSLLIGKEDTFIGMAYYVQGLNLKDIYKNPMQGFGKGIKFDFEAYEKGEKTFLEAFDNKRLVKFVGYQTKKNIKK